PVRDVAVVWVDPKVVTSVRPVPLGCAQGATPPVADDQEIFTIGVALRGPKDMTSGIVSRVEPHAIVSDVRLARGSAGGPVFTAGGGVIGITSLVEGKDESSDGHSRVVRVDEACDLVPSDERTRVDEGARDGP